MNTARSGINLDFSLACAHRRRQSISRAIAYIELSFRDSLSLDEIAALAYVSRFHFARLFKAEIGVSPLQYVRERRITEAERMLLDGRHSLLWIAADLGYYDHSHFCRAFKVARGLSPREFVQRHNARNLPRLERRLPLHAGNDGGVDEQQAVCGDFKAEAVKQVAATTVVEAAPARGKSAKARRPRAELKRVTGKRDILTWSAASVAAAATLQRVAASTSHRRSPDTQGSCW